MLWMHARKVYWKEWAAKHEHEELKAGIWFEHIQAMFRKLAVRGQDSIETWRGSWLLKEDDLENIVRH